VRRIARAFQHHGRLQFGPGDQRRERGLEQVDNLLFL